MNLLVTSNRYLGGTGSSHVRKPDFFSFSFFQALVSAIAQTVKISSSRNFHRLDMIYSIYYS